MKTTVIGERKKTTANYGGGCATEVFGVSVGRTLNGQKVDINGIIYSIPELLAAITLVSK